MEQQQFDNSDLPQGWSRTVSRSRPGTICYEHVNGRRLFRTPTAADDTYPKSGNRQPNNSTPQNVPLERGSENPQDVGSVVSVTRNSQNSSASNVSVPVSAAQTTPIRPSTESKSTPNSNSRGSRVAVIPQKASESRTVARSIVKDDDDEFDFPGMGRKSTEAESGKSSNNLKQDSVTKSLNRSDMETARPLHLLGSSRQSSSLSEGKDAKRLIPTDELKSSESSLKNERSSDRGYLDSGAGRKNDRRSPPRRSTIKDRQRSRSPHHPRTTRVRSRSTDRSYERPGSRSSMDADRNSNRDRFGLNESSSVKRSYPSSSSSITTGTSLATRGPAETKVVTGNYVGLGTSMKSSSDASKTRKSDEFLSNPKAIPTPPPTKLDVSVKSPSIVPKHEVQVVTATTSSHSGDSAAVSNSNPIEKSGSSTITLDQWTSSSPVANLLPNQVSTEGAERSTATSPEMNVSKKPVEARQLGSKQISMKAPSRSTDPTGGEDEAAEKLAQNVIDSFLNTSTMTQSEGLNKGESRNVSEKQGGTQKSEKQPSNDSRNGEVLSKMQTNDQDAILKLMDGPPQPPQHNNLTKDSDDGKGLLSIKNLAPLKSNSDQAPPVRESLMQSEGSNLLLNSPQQAVDSSATGEIPPWSSAGSVAKHTLEAKASINPLPSLRSAAGTVPTNNSNSQGASVELKNGSSSEQQVVVKLVSTKKGDHSSVTNSSDGQKDAKQLGAERTGRHQQVTAGEGGNSVGSVTEESRTTAAVKGSNESNASMQQEKVRVDSPLFKKSGGDRVVVVNETTTTTSTQSKPGVVDVTLLTTTNNTNASQAKPIVPSLVESSSIKSDVQMLPRSSSTNSLTERDVVANASSKKDDNKSKDGANNTTTNLAHAPPGGSTVSHSVGGGASGAETSDEPVLNSANLVVGAESSSKINASVKSSEDHHNKDTVINRPSEQQVDSERASSRVDGQFVSNVEGRTSQETQGGNRNLNDASDALPKSAAPNVVASSTNYKPPLRTSLSNTLKEPASAKPPLMTSLTRKRLPPSGSALPADKPPLVTSVSTNKFSSSSMLDSTKDKIPSLLTATKDHPGPPPNPSSSVVRPLVSNNNESSVIDTDSRSSTQVHPSQQQQQQRQQQPQHPRGSTGEVHNVIQEQDRKRARVTDSHSQRSGSSERSVVSDNKSTSQVQDSRPTRLPSPPIMTASASRRNSVVEPAAVLGGSNVSTRDSSSNKNSLEKPSAIETQSSSVGSATGQEKEVVTPVAANPLNIREWIEKNLLMSPASRKAVSDKPEELRRLGAVLATTLAKNISTVYMESSLAYDVMESLVEDYSVDLSACFVPDFPNGAAQFFKRFGMLYPAESTSWYVAKTHAYYMGLVAAEKKESESKQEQPQPVVMAVRISGLPDEHKLLNGLYARPTLPTQAGESIKKETYIFKKGETDDAIVKALLGRFALIHFVGRQWTLQRIDRADQLTCLATGDDAATNWVYATGMGEGALAWRSTSSIKLELRMSSD